MSYPNINFDDVKKALPETIEHAVKSLDSGRAYEITQILSNAKINGYNWSDFSGKQRRSIGSIARRIIRKGDTGLKWVGRRSNRHALYMRLDKALSTTTRLEA